MSVSTSNNKEIYQGSGSTGPFTFTYRFFADTDIKVYRTTGGVQSLLAITTDYTLSGAGSYYGGSITLVTALAVGETLTIVRELPISQLIDLTNQGAFFAEVHEDVFDRLVMIAQQLKEKIDRCLAIRVDASGVDPQLPLPSAGKGIKWNATGDGLVNTSQDLDATIATALAYATSAEAYAQDAEDSATESADSASAALASSQAATGAADAAEASAGEASTFATNAGTQASNAASSALSASGSASTATTKASEADASADAAALAAQAAGDSETDAGGSAATASAAASAASGSASAAAGSATAADTSAGEAAASALAADASADAAAQSAIEAAAWVGDCSTLDGHDSTYFATADHGHDEADLVLSDVTTGDASNTKHGFLPKLIDDIAKYLRSDGTWALVSGGATGGGTDQAFVLNDKVITTSYDIPSTKNAMTAGTVTVNDGVTITIPTGCSWTVV